MPPETIELILEYAESIGLAVLTCTGPPETKAALLRARLNALGHELYALFPDALMLADYAPSHRNGGTQ